ncbi:MAG: hypothetical protein Q9219_005516 [cf. Caloplaca sp. 3 TL-2023]
MDQVLKKGTGIASKLFGKPSLRELLHQRPYLIENYKKQEFFCKAAIYTLMDRATVSAWAKKHPLHRGSDDNADDENLVDRIVSSHRLLFAFLVAAELESFTFAILKEYHNDTSPPKINEKALNLSSEEQQRLRKSLQKFSPVFKKSEHEHLSFDTVLPFTHREETDKKGTFGKIYRVKVADGHLENSSQDTIAEKLVYLSDPKDEPIYLREVETLRVREHRNIVPLLASYSMKTTASDTIDPLHVIFPFADGGNLADWMKHRSPPAWLQSGSAVEQRREQRKFLYHSIYALVSGLSSLHLETDGTITAHHDLKPRNILIFGRDLKIADFGRSHLHLQIQGSETAVNSGLGTYEYQPPEYWTDDGHHAEVKHGRKFDMWSMGCIVIELATLIVYGWESGKVTEFRQRRKNNQSKQRPELARSHSPDASFHNNQNVVDEWICHLRDEDDSQNTLSTLKIAEQMMNQERESRLYAWEAALDLYNIQYPYDDPKVRLERVAMYVQSPPRPGKIPNGTQTPLHRAAESGNATRFNRLCELGWPLEVMDSQGLTAGMIFEQKHPTKKALAALVLKGSSEEGGWALLHAAARGDLRRVRDLLKEEVNALFVDQGQQSALYMAVDHNHCSIAECLLEAKGEELLRLKDDRSGNTPLHKAATMGYEKMMEILLSYHPNIEDKQKQEKTALFLAVEWGHEKAVNVLLDHGAQVYTLGDTGGTPLHAAAQQNLPQILRRLLRAPGGSQCVERKNQSGATPLWMALFGGSIECAEILRQHGVSLHVANNDGNNVVHVAVMKDRYGFLERNIGRFRRDEFRSRNRWGDTPLMIARKEQRRRLIKLLTPFMDGV